MSLRAGGGLARALASNKWLHNSPRGVHQIFYEIQPVLDGARRLIIANFSSFCGLWFCGKADVLLEGRELRNGFYDHPFVEMEFFSSFFGVRGKFWAALDDLRPCEHLVNEKSPLEGLPNAKEPNFDQAV